MTTMWRPRKADVENSNLYKFQGLIEEKYLQKFESYSSFHRFSVEKKDIFWRELFHFFNVRFSGELGPENLDSSFGSYGWFPKVQLNFAENLLATGKDSLHRPFTFFMKAEWI